MDYWGDIIKYLGWNESEGRFWLMKLVRVPGHFLDSQNYLTQTLGRFLSENVYL